jgi:hypothetical protein
MLCRIWGPNEAANTPGSRPLGQLGGEDSEQYRAMRRLVPASSFFFLKKKSAKRCRFDKNRDFFANFQFSPPTFNFVQYYSLIDPKTSDLMQFSPDITSPSAPKLRAFCNMVLGLGFMQFHP